MSEPAAQPAQASPITIKKYANRRLYNTATSSYVTLENLARMVKEGVDFVVYDAKSGDDITRSVLTQIIVEEEGKGQALLPTSFLRQLISFYGDQMQWMVPGYLDTSMKAFARNQDQMRAYFQDTLGGIFPFGKQNLAMMEQAMKFWSPFAQPGAGKPEGGAEAQLDLLRRQLEFIQAQIAAATKAGDKS